MTQIKHGYTLADLDDMARAAVAVDRLLVGDVHYRHSIASPLSPRPCTPARSHPTAPT